MRHHIRKFTLLLAVLATMAVAAPAWAETGDEGYKNGGENVAGNLQGAEQGAEQGGVAGTTGTSGETGGGLPFTGLDLALIFGVGGVLTAVGFGTRRLTRHADPA